MMSQPVAHSEHTHTDGSHEEHHGGTGLYLGVFVALCLLTLCSFWTYSPLWPSALDQAATKRAFMMAVSVTKAMLVIMFFMHLKWETNWKWVLTIPASLMSVFLMLMLIPDVGLRWNHASEDRYLYGANPVPVEEIIVTDYHKEHPPQDHHPDGKVADGNEHSE